jgi:hypothetical protein
MTRFGVKEGASNNTKMNNGMENYKYKCDHGEVDEELQKNAKTFNVSMDKLMDKRTVQQKVVEHLVLKLYKKETVLALIDILFKDMAEDAKLIDDHNERNLVGNEDDDNKNTNDEDSVSETNWDDDPTKYGIDNDSYISVKGVLTIEKIKDVIGEIMSTCQKTMKYEIL